MGSVMAALLNVSRSGGVKPEQHEAAESKAEKDRVKHDFQSRWFETESTLSRARIRLESEVGSIKDL